VFGDDAKKREKKNGKKKLLIREFCFPWFLAKCFVSVPRLFCFVLVLHAMA